MTAATTGCFTSMPSQGPAKKLEAGPSQQSQSSGVLLGQRQKDELRFYVGPKSNCVEPNP